MMMMKRFWIEGLLCTALFATGVAVFTTPSIAKPAFLTAEKAKNPDVKYFVPTATWRHGEGSLNPTGIAMAKDKKHSPRRMPGTPATAKPAGSFSVSQISS